MFVLREIGLIDDFRTEMPCSFEICEPFSAFRVLKQCYRYTRSAVNDDINDIIVNAFIIIDISPRD